jgi:phage-related protein
MNNKWKIIHYSNIQGKQPVFDFIQSLDPKTKSKMINLVDLLEEYGLQIGLPHSKKLTGTKLWELRILNPTNVRIFYIAIVNKKFLLLHGFIKKKQRTDNREIKLAEDRLNDYLNRN